jgi:predicted DNA-binding antitoxin AbrB/MazE fold protein
MPQAIQAIYRNGTLRLLDKVNLTDGQQVEVVIMSDEEKIRAVLGDLLLEAPENAPPAPDEAALLKVIAEGFAGQPPLSETILEERREGR